MSKLFFMREDGKTNVYYNQTQEEDATVKGGKNNPRPVLS